MVQPFTFDVVVTVIDSWEELKRLENFEEVVGLTLYNR